MRSVGVYEPIVLNGVHWGDFTPSCAYYPSKKHGLFRVPGLYVSPVWSNFRRLKWKNPRDRLAGRKEALKRLGRGGFLASFFLTVIL